LASKIQKNREKPVLSVQKPKKIVEKWAFLIDFTGPKAAL
jgi:hypothetical protein